ncbi:hypothetical protein CRG98_023030 [Punica granatum]|uniref:Reverse transcriptase domain-containing protein n=1 Tax=Punica granatum TaxID=22663 RepID=A0A2I0JM46_PUNGR|nr:hypothetical protein CRG98_023030 [Punica granatum]
MAVEDTKGINLVNSVPHISVSVYIFKYAKLIEVIAFLDTGAAQTIMNPEVLTKECWKPHIKHFSTASSEVFSTHLISQPLKIQFFHGCYLITRALGSTLPRKDIVVGWDIITKVNKLRMTPERVCFKHYFQPYVQTPRLFMAQEDEVKHILSEQDDKFPLPNKRVIFSSLSKAKVFPKFDLKAGFWQLGIHLDDRPKIGFCIPNAYYQWKVMPFRLKTAPSLFQKTMCWVFAPIMDQALIYIDDILLFSSSEEAHILLLRRFSEIVQNYGIILSEKKMVIGQREINFLGMQLANGQYQPEPHVAQELLKYPEESLTKKQIQQFFWHSQLP